MGKSSVQTVFLAPRVTVLEPMSSQPSCDGHTLIPEDASCLAAKGGPERGELAFRQHVRVVQQDHEGRYLFLSFESSAGGFSPSFHASEL